MSVSLKKGEKISLSKDNSSLKHITAGLGWDVVEKKKGIIRMLGVREKEFDCDASAFLLQNGKLVSHDDIVYFKNLHHKSQAVIHTGDNLTGVGEGDDEQINIDLLKLPKQYDKIVLVANIYDCQERKQHFGMIKNAFIRIVDADKNIEICKYNLNDDYTDMTALVFGEVYKRGEEWKFSAIGQGTKDTGLGQLANRFS